MSSGKCKLENVRGWIGLKLVNNTIIFLSQKSEDVLVRGGVLIREYWVYDILSTILTTS